MKRIKKLISTIVASTFLFSLAAPMAYAKTSDEAVNRLKALGTVTGYADGDMKLDQNITRAEFAAIAVRALGLDNAAKLSKGTTKFTDVNASHWATGYINLAVDRKVINGYPDKSFKPEQNVSNAEAIAMVVRALGYEQALEGGTWPTKYISKAAYLDLLENVSIEDYNAKATRGSVFMILDDALETNIWKLKETDDDGKQTWGEGKTLMQEKLKVEEYKDLLVDDVTTLYGNEKDEIGLSVYGNSALTGTFEVASGLKPFQYYGLNVKAYIKTDEDKVVTMAIDEDECFTDVVKTITSAGGGTYTLGFKDHDKETTVSAAQFYSYKADSATLTINTADYSASDIKPGDRVTVVLDGGKITKVIKLDLSAKTGIVNEVKNDKIYFEDAMSVADVDLDGVDMDYVQIFRDGKEADLDEIKAGDTASYLKSGDSYTIFVSSNEVTGILKAAGTVAGYAYKLTVDDKVIVTTTGSQYSTNTGDDYEDSTQDALGDDVVGKKVTVKLDANGQAAFIITDSKGDTNQIKAIVRNVTYEDSVGSDDDDYIKYVKVTKLDGTETVYTIDNDDYTIKVGGVKTKATLDLDGKGEIKAGDFAYLTLDSNGKVTDIDEVDDKGDKVIDLNVATAVYVNDDRDIISVTGTGVGTYLVNDATKVFDVEKQTAGVYNELNKITWSALEDDLKASYKANTKLWVDGSEIIAIFVNTEVTGGGSDDLWGVTFGGKYAIGSGDYAGKVWTAGAQKEYTIDSASSFTGNKVITFSVNGDNEIEDIVVKNALVAGVDVDDVDTTNGKIIINNDYVAMADELKVFDYSDDTMTTGEKVSRDDIVDLYDILDADGEVGTPDGIIDVIVIR